MLEAHSISPISPTRFNQGHLVLGLRLFRPPTLTLEFGSGGGDRGGTIEPGGKRGYGVPEFLLSALQEGGQLRGLGAGPAGGGGIPSLDALVG